MRVLLGIVALLASCGFAMAECEALRNSTDDTVAYLCEIPNAKAAPPKCHYFDSDRLLCTGEIGQPVSRERVKPTNCDWRHGKFVCR